MQNLNLNLIQQQELLVSVLMTVDICRTWCNTEQFWQTAFSVILQTAQELWVWGEGKIDWRSATNMMPLIEDTRGETEKEIQKNKKTKPNTKTGPS